MTTTSEKRFLEISHLTKAFGAPGAEVKVVDGFDLTVARGEFVCLIGHSGCGKSTVLSIIAGLARASSAGVILDGREVTEPGTDRGVVFQSACLLPWMTAFENVLLAAAEAHPGMKRSRLGILVEHHLRQAGLGDALHKKPSELSAGMRQRVGIARAFVLDPKLLLDEPFGMLDSLTRFELQQVLLDVWGKDQRIEGAGAAGGGAGREWSWALRAQARGRKTAFMVTHDVDEALFLSDRIALMTSGPGAHLGGIIEVPFPRPRDRAAIMEHPRYYELREALIAFLDAEAHGPREKAQGLGAPPTLASPALTLARAS